MILGIDPGLSGALAVYNPQSNLIVNATNIPVLRLQRNGKNKSSPDFHRLMQVITNIAKDYNGLRAVLELVGAMPRQGVSSMFAFGSVTGALKMAVVAAQIPFTEVTPQKWKKALGCTADKDGALLRASQLMPGSVEFWTPMRLVRDKQDCIGIAEASLLAYYGAKNLP